MRSSPGWARRSAISEEPVDVFAAGDYPVAAVRRRPKDIRILLFMQSFERLMEIGFRAWRIVNVEIERQFRRNMRRYRSVCGVRRGGQGNPPMRLGRLFARERRLYN